jgi:hypothetical protein
MDLGQDRMRLIDAREHSSLLRYGDTIRDGEYPDEIQGPRTTLYGVYMPQPGTLITQADTDANNSRNHWHRVVVEDVAHVLGVVDLISMEPIQIGNALRIPIAVLVCYSPGDANLLTLKRGQPITASLLFENLTPASNILNRPGLLAFDSQDTKAIGSKAPWANLIDRNRVRRAALRIR